MSVPSLALIRSPTALKVAVGQRVLTAPIRLTLLPELRQGVQVLIPATNTR